MISAQQNKYVAANHENIAEEVAMKAIIHIGMPKTGTTSIQTWLHSNCATLETAGVHSITGHPITGVRHLLLQTSIHMAMLELGVDEKTAWEGMEGRPVTRNLGLEVDENADRLTMTEQKRSRAEKIKSAYDFMTEKLEAMSGKSGVFVSSDERLYKMKNLIPALDRYLARFFEKIIGYFAKLVESELFFHSRLAVPDHLAGVLELSAD